jgi:hypothetical protein
MNPDLMRSTRLQPTRHKRRDRTKTLNHFVSRDRVPTRFAFLRDPPAQRIPIRYQRPIDHPARTLWRTLNHRQITPLRDVPLEQFLKRSLRLRRPSHRNGARRILVQPMNHPHERLPAISQPQITLNATQKRVALMLRRRKRQ